MGSLGYSSVPAEDALEQNALKELNTEWVVTSASRGSLNLSGLARQPTRIDSLPRSDSEETSTCAVRPSASPAVNVTSPKTSGRPRSLPIPLMTIGKYSGKAVIANFDHQSQEATDIRWLRLMFKICLGAHILC